MAAHSEKTRVMAVWAAVLCAALGGCGNSETPGGRQSVYQLQDESHEAFLAEGSEVSLVGVVVTAIDHFGPEVGDLYVQEPAGGAYSGILVLDPALTEDATRLPRVGDLVAVSGRTVEIEIGDGALDTTTALEDARLKVLDGGPPPVPTPLDLSVLSQASLLPFEGVFVRLFHQRPLGAFVEGRVHLTPDLWIGDELSDAIGLIYPNTCYASLDGVMTIRHEVVLQPRALPDIVVSVNDDDCAPGPPEQCEDGLDNDGDGHVDCADFDCQGTTYCQTERDCTDGLDNDNDGFPDCTDEDCRAAYPQCTETQCDDGEDNDRDGRADCEDVDCDIQPHCQESDCADGVDNDGDGLVDCQEFGCRNTSGQCFENTPALCTDGLDNDGDGLVDCADLGCQFHPDVLASGVCAAETGDASCSDGVDNDNDGVVDCEDWNCEHNWSMTVCNDYFERNAAACADGIDNDGNGYTDCGDFNCRYHGFCPTYEVTDASCMDGVDNDGNGHADCQDWSCQFSVLVTVCEGSLLTCSDGLDNDGNGFADCEDLACRNCSASPPRRSLVCPRCS